MVVVVLTAVWDIALPWPRPSYEMAWIQAIYARKETAAARIDEPKVVLIGGSATHFGFSAEQIGREIGAQVVNLGTHAGLGADYILARAKRSLKRGDTAVLVLEYHLLKASAPTDIASSFVSMFDPRYAAEAKAAEVPRFVWGISPQRLLSATVQRTIPYTSPLYRVETVTELGDETAGSNEEITPAMRAAARSYPPIPVLDLRSDWPLSSISSFVQWAHADGVTVKYVWPPMVGRSAYATDPRYSELFSAIRGTFEGLAVPVLGQPSDFFLGEDELLDNFYHANQRGRLRMSNQLARVLDPRAEDGELRMGSGAVAPNTRTISP
ncbi:hypothetical protein M2175_001256 [Bradyrhizobium elkanii]|uniref:hypothetical protein n=1 Tax=Bradyrhizobium TaxID=374 RepID=UPI002168ACFE|nr:MULTISPECIES: hypothetical protein [Bradyrhizobium]MCS3926225.1 hypothetical protein [Bradyrhizobium elkanii]MCS3966777.1 hypothetical protein [Bradyrhizobium japonicum]